MFAAFHNDILRLLVWVVACFSLVGGVPATSLAEPFGFDGSWDYRKQGGDQEGKTSTEQTYKLIFDKSLSASSRFSGFMRYSKESQDTDNDTELFNPSATLDLRNDLFSVNLNGASRQQTTQLEPDLERRSWNANLMTLSREIPQIRLNYGETTIEDDQSPRIRDTKSSIYGGSVNYAFAPFRFLYDLRFTENDNFVTLAENETKNQLGSVQYQQSFFDQRFTITASEQINTSESDTITQTELGVPVFQRLAPSALGGAYVANDDTPADTAMALQNGLIDLDFSTEVVEILQPAQDVNLGLNVGFSAINRVDVVLSDLLSSINSSQLTWSAYTSSNNVVWTQVPILSIAYVDDFIDGSLATVVEVELVDPSATPLTVNYIKLVVSSPGAPAILDNAFVTEVEAGLVSIGTGVESRQEFESKQYFSALGFTYRPSDLWSLDYNVSHKKFDIVQGFDRTELVQTLATTYSPYESLSFRASVNESTDEVELQLEQLDRTYSISAYASPLETLDVTIGLTRLDSYEDDDKTQTIDTLTLYSSALIYPDLSSAINVLYSQLDNILSGTNTDRWSSSLVLTSRISPKLNVDAQYDYSHSTTESQIEPPSKSIDIAYSATVSYRPSNVLLIQTRGLRQESLDRTTLFGSFAWRMTPSLQLSQSANVTFAQSDTGAYTTRLDWATGRHFSLDTSYTYRTTETADLYDLLLSLNANF